jgi:DNA polymerase-3 subunit delta'
VSVLEAHPHAAAVLGAALRGRPSHAYLFHGPAGTGKREAARMFAAELLSRDVPDPDGARARALHGSHPDLTWVAPSGAHIMLRGDVDHAVVAAASHTPFEATYRVFVLERADTMDDPAANTLLKTLEEPPGYVVLILLTDRPTQVLPTIASRCQPVRFDPLPPEQLAARLQSRGVEPAAARACACLSLGDGERALALALGDGPALRSRAEAFARAPIQGTVGATKPWGDVLAAARARGQAAEAELEQELAAELEYLPKKEHKRKASEFAERSRRAARRAETGAIDHALQLAALWYRDLSCLALGAEELVLNTDRDLGADGLPDAAALHEAVELVEETRARLPFNVSYDLALQALAYRLERLLSAESSSSRAESSTSSLGSG